MHHELWFRALACDAGSPDWLPPIGEDRASLRKYHSHDPPHDYSGNDQSDYESQKQASGHLAVRNCHLGWLGNRPSHSSVTPCVCGRRGLPWFAVSSGILCAVARCGAPLVCDGGSGLTTLFGTGRCWRVRPRHSAVSPLATRLSSIFGAQLPQPVARLRWLSRLKLLDYWRSLIGCGFSHCRRRPLCGDGFGLLLRDWCFNRLTFRPQIPALTLFNKIRAVVPMATLRRWRVRRGEAILFCARGTGTQLPSASATSNTAVTTEINPAFAVRYSLDQRPQKCLR